MSRKNRINDLSSTQIMYKARALKMLRGQVLLSRAGLLVEQLTRAFWPIWTLMFLGWAGFSFGVLRAVSPEVGIGFVLAFGLVFLILAGLGVRRFDWPTRDDAIDRLDRSVPNRPLSALWDTQALGAADADSTGVWRAHLGQMAERARAARARRPDLRISTRDPFGIRYLAATAFIVALIFAPSMRQGGLKSLIGPQNGPALAAGPIFEGWIEPPRYTGLPVIYLNDATAHEALPVPQGSKITLRLYGSDGTLSVRETVSGRVDGPADPDPADPDPKADPTANQQEFTVRQSGELLISGIGGNAAWKIDMKPDLPPLVTLAGPVERGKQGETRLTFDASDDYGVVAGTVTFALDLGAVDRRYGLARAPENRASATRDLPMPFTGDTRAFHDTMIEDMTRHPWAGLPVTVTLSAVDANGQTTTSEPESVILPARRFFDPLAAAIIDQRRALLWTRLNAPEVAQILRTISYLPEDIFDNPKAYLVLQSALHRIEFNLAGGLSDSVVDDVSDLMWHAALLIEEGDISNAEARLKRAQDRLSEALKNGAPDDEISQLTDELRRAMQDYLRQLTLNAEQDPDKNPAPNSQSQQITRDQLQKMLDRIQELSRQGRTAEAQQLLEQLRQMMKNMRVARQQQGQGPGQQAMRNLQDTLRQQQNLSDDAFRKLQDQFNGQSRQGQNPPPGQRGQGQAGSGQQPNGLAPSQQSLTQRQEALRQLLEQQNQALPSGGTDQGRAARRALREAERQMGEARNSLKQGDLPGALDNQAQALDSLRKGLDQLGRELAKTQNGSAGRQGEQAGSPDPNSNRDPLGRKAGSVGRLGADLNLLNGNDRVMRSRELMDEIRRRTGEKSRPKFELDYLNRLLDRF